VGPAERTDLLAGSSEALVHVRPIRFRDLGPDQLPRGLDLTTAVAEHLVHLIGPPPTAGEWIGPETPDEGVLAADEVLQ